VLFDINSFLIEMKCRKEYVDKCLIQCMTKNSAYPPLIHEAMNYAVFNGGKRLRPIMVFEGAALAGSNKEKVITAACAIEMIHSYSLVHDDLPAMDDDELRRGKPTCHIVYGEANAILTGDALLTAAFELLASNCRVESVKVENIIKVIGEIARAAGSRGMIGGQVIDLESEGKTIDCETLKTLHRLKTGELFKASLKAGAILSDMEQDGLHALDEYAENFGLAFQITDDILDVEGSEELTGKPAGSDEKNHKTTYPSLFGLEKSRQLAREAVEACTDILSCFGAEADFLRNLALYTLNRNY